MSPTFHVARDPRGRLVVASGVASAQPRRPPSLELRVVAFLRLHPGSSLRGVRTGVGGAGTAVDAAVKRLIRSGSIEDRGGAVARRLFVIEGPRGIGADTP
jgi:hypothetical protein